MILRLSYSVIRIRIKVSMILNASLLLIKKTEYICFTLFSMIFVGIIRLIRASEQVILSLVPFRK